MLYYVMPYAAGKPCRNKQCSNVTHNRSGYCDECQSERWKTDKRATSRERGYDRRWELVRAVYLRRHPLCEDCQDYGVTAVADMVHHIRAISDGGDAYDVDNLRSLCWACHGKYAKSDAEIHTGERFL